ncbi:rhamnulokinase [Vibrio sp. S12_S33]|uniref:rhamnulokinase n=1 Tax=Vibrio sp. S12_S33 TaxID=2720223 RepID=UPI00177DD59A|nr:rhamnulokinase family protein [Vibrio sp. S12_S33]MBD1567402.1 rhamnulokinase [Vibrio sp. S12_S33]
MNVCIAVDLGSSNGRVMAGYVDQGKLYIKEIHRFDNVIIFNDGEWQWEHHILFNQICVGLKKVESMGFNILSIGVDTWGVDFVLLDEFDKKLLPDVAYRDLRTNGYIAKRECLIDESDMFCLTSIQSSIYNTLYQLMSLSDTNPRKLAKVRSFLFTPDYFHYLLSGKKMIEQTIASTSQMLSLDGKNWSSEILQLIKLPINTLTRPIPAGTVIGKLNPKLADQLGLRSKAKIIAPASHDTASAFVAVPATSKYWAVISSGTWSLLGIESSTPLLGSEIRNAGFSNERGVYDSFSIVKNMIGMWLIQRVKMDSKTTMSYGELVQAASQVKSWRSFIDPNDTRFLNPKNMVDEIRAYCKQTLQPVPQSLGEIARCIFESLALAYRVGIEQLEQSKSHKFEQLHMVGGGIQNEMLCQLTADVCQIKVVCGPIEGSALGNIVVQMISLNQLDNIADARIMIKDSFELTYFEPQNLKEFAPHWKRFVDLISSKIQ